jgi:ATP-dependent DNA ligase
MSTDVYSFFQNASLDGTEFNLEFPTLFSAKEHLWRVYLHIKRNETDEMVKINIDTIWEDTPANCYVEYITEYGKKTLSSMVTTVTNGKNLGKKNQTTYFTQAVSDIYSLYKKKRKLGYYDVAVSHEQIKTVDDIISLRGNPFVYSQQLQWFQKHDRKITFPLLCQPKLNGLQGIFIRHKGISYLYSRQLLPFEGSVDCIIEEMQSYPEDIYFVGELYIHGVSLQDLNSIARKKNRNDDLIFYIFDMFSLGRTDTAWERMTQLSTYVKESPHVKLLPTIITKSKEEVDKLLDKYISQGYEGVVCRLHDKPHEYDIFYPKRSFYVFKYKKTFDDEFPVRGYVIDRYEGVVFICMQSDNINNAPPETRSVFRVVPNWTQADRKNFATILKRKGIECLGDFKLDIVYNDLSDSGIPLQAKCITPMSRCIEAINANCP